MIHRLKDFLKSAFVMVTETAPFCHNLLFAKKSLVSNLHFVILKNSYPRWSVQFYIRINVTFAGHTINHRVKIK